MDNEYITGSIVLKALSAHDADSFYNLYAALDIISSIHFDETPMEYTRRIMSLCNCIFTIRTTENRSMIIGDCALHHWDKQRTEIEIGGVLLPDYWGKGVMASAFQVLSGLAKQEYFAKRLVAKTDIANSNALRFAEKNGFLVDNIAAGMVILTKDI